MVQRNIESVQKLLVDYTHDMVSRLEYPEKRYPANVAFAISEILKLFKDKIEPIDYVYLHRKFIEIHEKLIETTYSHFFGSLYKPLQFYKKQDYDEMESWINPAIYDVEIMNVNILYSILYDFYENLDDSLSNCFFDRVGALVKFGELIINNEHLRRLWILTLYGLCTVNKVLNLYLQTHRETYRDIALDLCSRITKILSDYINRYGIKDIQNKSLLTYILYNLEVNKQFVPLDSYNTQSAIMKIKGNLSKIYPEVRFDVLCWICVNLYHIDKNLFNEVFKLFLDRLLKMKEKISKQQLPQVVLTLAYYLSDKCVERLKFDFPIDFKRVNFEDIFKIIFPKYLQIHEIDISESDILKLYDMSDSEIRNALAKIIKMSDKIPDYIKQKLDIESQKPHTSAEISDFEIPIEVNRQTLHVCFPIKSGKIQTTTVPEKFIYQILRPFIHYKHCVVIFITAKKCSLNLRNTIEKYKERFSIPIEVLEDRNLAKLFKIYGIL